MNLRDHPEPPTTHWRDDDTGAPFRLTWADAGVHLGTNRDGRVVTLPAGPAPTRIAVLGESLFGRLFGLRMLAVGARVTAATRVPDQWRPLARVAADRLTVADGVAAWPPGPPPAPPAQEGGPQALVCDLRRPPSAALANAPWRTVLHVTRDAPRRSYFWSAPDALLALDARFADTTGRLLGEEAARRTASLSPGEIILFRPTGTEILRPDISPAETTLLTPGHA
ncbi:hypothetical protein [Streptomyces mayteni]